MKRLGTIDRELLFKRQSGRCYYCGTKLSRGKDDGNRDGKRLTVDHKIPQSEGGETSLENCVCACRSCNGKKSNSPLCSDWQHDNARLRAIGKLGGLSGGPARALALTPERRKEIARIAAIARWGKRDG